MNYDLVLLCAGKSKRFTIDKILSLINDKPLFFYSLNFFSKQNVNKYIIVINKQNKKSIEKYLQKYFLNILENIILVIGGNSRSESVNNSLKHITSEYVIIHDGARPFICQDTYNKAIKNLKDYQAISLASNLTNTVKDISNNLPKTLERNNLVEIITPQFFSTEILKKAYKLAIEFNKKINKNFEYYDDLSLIEIFIKNSKIKIIITWNKYLKITYPIDLLIAKIILEKMANE